MKHIKFTNFFSVILLSVVSLWTSTSIVAASFNEPVGKSFVLPVPKVSLSNAALRSWSYSCYSSNISVTNSGGEMSLGEAEILSYFSGSETIECWYQYTIYNPNGTYTVGSSKEYHIVTCIGNDISISGPKTQLNVGESMYLSYSFDRSTYGVTPKITWRCSSNVASVDDRGYVKALKAGEATITAQSNLGGNVANYHVTVRAIEPTSVSLPSSISMTVGETYSLTPTLYPSDAQSSFSWSSSNSPLATVSSSGVVTAKKSGSVDITVKTSNGLSATCKVSIQKPKLSLSASHPSGLLLKGTKITLSASAPNSVIYYTLDGSSPTTKSKIYNDGIVISDNTVIKAFAKNEDYIDSDVLSLSYSVNDMSVDCTIPQNNSNVFWSNFAFSIVFNQDISEGKQFDRIVVLDSTGNEVPIIKSIVNNTLSLIPIDGFKFDEYKVSVPADAVQSTRKQYPNFELNYSFTNSDINSVPYNEVVGFDAGYYHSLVVKSDGSLWSFGGNGKGQLGDGSNSDRYTPVKTMDNVKMTIANWFNGYAIKNDNSLWSWGANDNGLLLGDGSNTDRYTPVKIMDNIVFANSFGHRVFAINENGELYAWGKNYYGALGDGTTTSKNIPEKVALEKVQLICSGESHTAAITLNNDLYTWGYNNYGQLGDGTKNNQYTPIKVLSGIIDVATPCDATIVLDTDGNVWSWGGNSKGQLGLGENGNVIQPQTVIKNIKKLGHDDYTVFAISNDNKLYGWGDLSIWGKGTIKTPTIIMENVKDVKSFHYHALIQKTDGSLWGIGRNILGQLGCQTESDIVTEPILIFSDDSPKIESVAPLSKNVTIEVGESAYFPFNIEPANASIAQVNWTASNGCIRARENGIIEGIKVGKTVLTCRIVDSYDIVKEFSVDVNVVAKGTPLDEIFTEDSSEDIEYYNISGVKVSPENLNSGIYIIKKGNKVEKTIVK